MTAIDWVLLAIVAISALLGLMRGFVGVVLSLLSWVLAGVVAYLFGGDAATMLSDDVQPSMGYLIGGYLLCFGIVMVAVKLLSWFVQRVLASVGLSGVDRSLGLAFGLVRGGLFACVLVLLMGFTSLPRERQWQQSQTIPVFEPGARWLSGLLPDGIARQVDFAAGGPLSPEAWQRQGQALEPLIGDGGVLGQDPQALLGSLGEQLQGGMARTHRQALPLPATGDLLPLQSGQAPGEDAGRMPSRDPANVDGGPGHAPAEHVPVKQAPVKQAAVKHDPAAVEGPSSQPSHQP